MSTFVKVMHGIS